MNEEELKLNYLSWLESVRVRRTAYLKAKENLKKAENEYVILKRTFNKAYKDWKQSRVEVERSKRKWKSYPYQLRQWAKQHWGKVFDMMEEKNNE